jgi:hypothetical protein
MKIEFTRPLRQTTEGKVSEMDATLLTPADAFVLDWTTKANGSPRLLGRVKAVPEVKGSQCRLNLFYLGYSESASQPYSGADKSPFSEAEADNAIALGSTPWTNLHELYSIAGEEPSR